MANLNVSNKHNLKLYINNDEYWDFYVSKDSYACYGNIYDGSSLHDKCLISYIDMADDDCLLGDGWVCSNGSYHWDDAIAVGNTLYNISYVGVDNGLFTYRKDRITNKDFIEFFKDKKYVIEDGDYRLKMHPVSGNNLVYDYPISYDDSCKCTKLNGGFYQGFFKTECDKYQILPSNYNDGDILHFEFTLKKCDFEKESEQTLNDKYPSNKGIFFYLGTRAENKWVYQYDKEDVDGLEECFEIGVDDFVEDGEIDKNEHIIGNFYEPNPEFVEDPIWDMGNYTTFNYYDEELYSQDPCDWEDMSDYLEIEPSIMAKTIDESQPYETILDCCEYSKEPTDANKFVLKPFYNVCGCFIGYRRENASEGQETSDRGFGCDDFGEGYIDGLDMLPSEDYDYIESELDITDFEYFTKNGFNFAEANQYYFYTDNKFLMFDRTCGGMTVKDWVEGTEYMYYGRRNKFNGNLFILMNRTSTGFSVNDIDELRDENLNEYNPYDDLYDNALAFRITDDGEIGYRLVTIDCEKEGRDKTLMMEGYSFANVIPKCEWFTVNARLSFLGGDKMKIMFYVNGKLVYITKELPRLRLRALNDLYEKQEGVPFNISIGGGTQGLAETVQYNYMLEPTRVYPLEKYFAGSFIGYFKSFRVYDCLMEKVVIEGNSKYEVNHINEDK